MTIDREYLDKQRVSLEKQREQALSTAASCDGAIQLCEAMLARLDAPESELPTE